MVTLVVTVTVVMVDPVGTGFSKPLGEAKGEDFWGVDQDIRSVGSFIKEYVSLNGRWASPKYILGESYGGIRTAGLVWQLQSVQTNIEHSIPIREWHGRGMDRHSSATLAIKDRSRLRHYPEPIR